MFSSLQNSIFFLIASKVFSLELTLSLWLCCGLVWFPSCLGFTEPLGTKGLYFSLILKIFRHHSSNNFSFSPVSFLLSGFQLHKIKLSTHTLNCLSGHWFLFWLIVFDTISPLCSIWVSFYFYREKYLSSLIFSSAFSDLLLNTSSAYFKILDIVVFTSGN